MLLSYTAMAATRYGGMPLTPVDNGSLSYAQLLYPDIDRRGNLLNLLHNNLGTRPPGGGLDRASPGLTARRSQRYGTASHYPAKYAHNNASSPPPEILTMYQVGPMHGAWGALPPPAYAPLTAWLVPALTAATRWRHRASRSSRTCRWTSRRCGACSSTASARRC